MGIFVNHSSSQALFGSFGPQKCHIIVLLPLTKVAYSAPVLLSVKSFCKVFHWYTEYCKSGLQTSSSCWLAAPISSHLGNQLRSFTGPQLQGVCPCPAPKFEEFQDRLLVLPWLIYKIFCQHTHENRYILTWGRRNVEKTFDQLSVGKWVPTTFLTFGNTVKKGVTGNSALQRIHSVYSQKQGLFHIASDTGFLIAKSVNIQFQEAGCFSYIILGRH